MPGRNRRSPQGQWAGTRAEGAGQGGARGGILSSRTRTTLVRSAPITSWWCMRQTAGKPLISYAASPGVPRPLCTGNAPLEVPAQCRRKCPAMPNDCSLLGKGTGKEAPALPSYFPKAWSAKPSVKNCQSIIASARQGGWGGAASADKTKGMAQLQE
jgi:hypothetical protein